MTADKTCMVCQYGKDGDRMRAKEVLPYATGPVGFADGLDTARFKE